MCTSGRVCALRSENEKWTLKSNSSCHIINWILASGACTTEIFFLLSHGAFSFPLPTNLAFIHIYTCIYVYIFFSNVSRGHVEYFWRIDNERPREERLSRKLARNAVDWREFVGMTSSNLSLDAQRIYNRRITVLSSMRRRSLHL